MKPYLRALATTLASVLLLTGSLLGPAAPAHAASCAIATTADGRPYVAPTASGPGTGKKVGFDNTHAETAGNADWVLDGGFSEMACAIAGQGYTVEEIRAYPLTQAGLSGYNAVVMGEPNTPFTTAEEQALEQYVGGGGGLLLVGDHYQADRNLNTWDATEVFNGFRRGHYNQTFTAPAYNYNGFTTPTMYTFNNGNDWLATAFGFRFRYNAMDLVNSATGKFAAGDPTDPEDPGILAPAQTYGVTQGVNLVATYAGSTIAIVDPTRAIGVVYPNKGSLKRWANAQANDPVALYTDSVGTPAGGSATFGGSNEGAYVVIAKPGGGKVAAAGDSSLWEDATPRYKREDNGSTKSTHAGWTDSDHGLLGINLINWLATVDATPGIDSALQQPVTPEPYDPFTIGEPLNEPWSTPPAGYRWYDATSFKPGAYNGSATPTPPPGGGGAESWTWNPLPPNAYPGNKLAIFMDAQGLTPNAPYATQDYLYVTAGGTQISKRYNRTSGLYDASYTALTAQSLPADSAGKLQRWEFWDLQPATANRALSARIKVGSSNKVTQALSQVATGSFGYLSIEQSLGYSDGIHAALFSKNSALDTAVQILGGGNTTVTLPAGTYSLDIKSDTATQKSNVAVTITAGQTASLSAILAGGGDTGGTWTLGSVPDNVYPGNKLALFVDGQGLTPNGSYATREYLEATDSGLAASRRYNRATGSFDDALTARNQTAGADGRLQRWEFWDLDQPAADRDLTARVKVNELEKVTQSVHQVAAGTFGYLTAESSLGYSDGLHAALLHLGSNLDTTAWIAAGGDTTITLPAGTYSLDIRNDTATKRSGVTVTITAGQTASLNQILNGGGTTPPPAPAGWSFNPVPVNAYPGNQLAVFLNGAGQTAATEYSTQAYLYVNGSGLQVSRRYNRTSGQFADGLATQTLTTDAQGNLARWEFWELTSAATRKLNVRLKVNGSTKQTIPINQVAAGPFGYLTIEQALGYSDGLHAGVFNKDGAVDTAVRILPNADTTVTLPAGTYMLDVRTDSENHLTGIPVTITAGQTTSLTAAMDQTPPAITAARTPANEHGWNNGDVTVTFTCTDAGSGIATCPAPVTLTTEGAAQQVTGTAVDQAGNTAGVTVDGINIDRTAPVTTATAPTGWTRDGAVALQGSDPLSGVLASYYSLDGGPEQSGTAVTISGDGQHALSFWSVDKAGNSEAPQSITVAIDKTVPTITAERTPSNADGWNNADVTVTFTCADAGSGVATCPDPVSLTAEGAGQHVTGTATDAAGNTASVTVDGINIDRTAPVTTATAPTGWTRDASVTLSADDALSGVAATYYRLDGGPEQSGSTVNISGDGPHTLRFWSVDKAGNVETAQSVTVAVDQTAPTITAKRTPANANFWNNDDVTVTFTCADAGSGIANCPDPVSLTAEGAGQHVTGTATDAAGNTASVTVDGINIDRSGPTVTFAGARTYTVDETVTLTCTAADGLSGLAGEPCAAPLVSGPAYKQGPGPHTVTVTATDKAGNTTTASATYTVSVTYTSLVKLIKSFIPNKGLATAFEAALKAAEAADARGNTPAQNAALDAFIHQVQAQRGKALTAEQADLLAAWAAALKH